MKKIMAYLLGCCFSLMVCAQDTIWYFNKLFQTDTSSRSFVAVKPVEDGYLTVGDINVSFNYSATYVCKLDKNGNKLWSKTIDEVYNGYNAIFFGNCLVDTYDNNYVVASEKGTTVQTADWVLTKITPDGDTLWQKKYAHLGQEANAQVMATTDWGYMLAGWTAFYNANGTPNPPCMYLVKTDYKGDTLWTRQYCDDDSAVLLYAEQTQDNGYIMSGYRYSNTTGYDMIVIKVGEFGNEEWRKTFGTDQNDGGCYATQLKDSNYMLLGWKYGLEGDIYYVSKLYANDGHEVWHREYFFNETTGNAGQPYVDTDGNVVIVIYNYSPNTTKENKLTKISSVNGDIIWQSPTISSGLYTNVGEGLLYCYDYIRDIEPTPDGGFVLAGFNYQSPQSAWLVKVDSLGNTCSFMNCDSTIYTGYPIGLDEVLLDKVAFSIVPNPANNYFDVYLNNELTPNQQLSIYDINGRLLQTTAINGQHTLVNVAHLPSGMYYCKLSNDSSVQKLVIIK